MISQNSYKKNLLINKKIHQNTETRRETEQLCHLQKLILQNKQTNMVKSIKSPNNQQKVFKFPSFRDSKLQDNEIYIQRQIIGEGAFAKVRVASRKTDGILCVIKSYEKYKINSEHRKKSIFKEIEILKEISHPNIIKIIDSYETQDAINIVMQHFSNQSLASYTKQNWPLEEKILKDITKSIGEALAYLHKNKISHRDLKPQNILINSNKQIKIIDLGLAMMGDHQEMLVAGTPQFMSPELINKKKYNPYKADIWAFGILLYWLALGYYPQDNCKKTKLSKKITIFQLKFPIDFHPGIQYLIQRMLEIDPDLRIEAIDILDDSWIKPRNIQLQIKKLINLGGSSKNKIKK